MISKHWPYPALIAHRGGGALAPENTLSGIKTGIMHGYRMIEVDVKLSSDHTLFLLHDDTLERTTDLTGLAQDKTWEELSQADAGSWFNTRFRGEPLVSLEEVATLCVASNIAINLEIKANPRQEEITALAIAHSLPRLFKRLSHPPLLSSFSVTGLRAIRRAGLDCRLALLSDQWDQHWQVLSQELTCFSYHLNHELLTPERVQSIKNQGLFVLAYTVNDLQRGKELFSWGVDAIFTDALDHMLPLSRPDVTSP